LKIKWGFLPLSLFCFLGGMWLKAAAGFDHQDFFMRGAPVPIHNNPAQWGLDQLL
jgi:hypothetical protein